MGSVDREKRIEELERRVEALEDCVRMLADAATEGPPNYSVRKLVNWVLGGRK